jgi:hypothetical protein
MDRWSADPHLRTKAWVSVRMYRTFHSPNRSRFVKRAVSHVNIKPRTIPSLSASKAIKSFTADWSVKGISFLYAYSFIVSPLLRDITWRQYNTSPLLRSQYSCSFFRTQKKKKRNKWSRGYKTWLETVRQAPTPLTLHPASYIAINTIKQLPPNYRNFKLCQGHSYQPNPHFLKRPNEPH